MRILWTLNDGTQFATSWRPRDMAKHGIYATVTDDGLLRIWAAYVPLHQWEFIR